MEETTKDIKKGVKIALKTLGDCFIVIMLAICSIFVLFPSFSLKIHKSLGMKKMQELDYQMIYAKSDNIADLYNIILFEEQYGNTKKELVYIDKIIERDDYYEFCASMDKSIREKLKDNSQIAYTANTNGYLLSRKVTIMYKSGVENINSYVYRQAKSGKITEYTFYTYVNLIDNDKTLTVEQKKEILTLLVGINDGSGSFESLVEKRIGMLKTSIIQEDDEKKQLAYKGVLLRFYDANATLYEILGDEDKAEENLNLYNKIRAQIYA